MSLVRYVPDVLTMLLFKVQALVSHPLGAMALRIHRDGVFEVDWAVYRPRAKSPKGSVGWALLSAKLKLKKHKCCMAYALRSLARKRELALRAPLVLRPRSQVRSEPSPSDSGESLIRLGPDPLGIFAVPLEEASPCQLAQPVVRPRSPTQLLGNEAAMTTARRDLYFSSSSFCSSTSFAGPEPVATSPFSFESTG